MLIASAGTLHPLRAQSTTVTYVPSDSLFPNPERGFYAHEEVQSGGRALSQSDLSALRSENVTLVLRLYYLKAFRFGPLDQAQLTLMRQDLQALRAAGLKAVLRFAYSSSASEEDASLAIILGHIDQIGPLLSEYADVIATLQAGFIGAWGEWHASTNGLETTESQRQVLEALLGKLPPSRMVQVRTPGYKMNIFGRTTALSEAEAFRYSNFARTAHHNDCFLRDASDSGTYQGNADRAFTEVDTRYTVVGGETCGVSSRSTCTVALDEMARYHWSFLNRGYHPGVLSSWGACMDEIRRRLGYRFTLGTATAAASVSPGQGLSLRLRLSNVGFAAPYNPRRVEAVLRRQQTGERYLALLPVDPRFWLPGSPVDVDVTLGIPAGLPAGRYDVLLNLPDPAKAIYTRPEYAIRLANTNVWESATGYNRLGLTVDVRSGVAGSAYKGSLWVKPYAEYLLTSSEGTARAGDALQVEAFPNPAHDVLHVTFNAVHAGRVRLALYDALGRQVGDVNTVELRASGQQVLDISLHSLPAGYYVLQAFDGETLKTRTFVRVR